MRNYQLVESAPYCCVAASIESILRRHGFNTISQYDIANYIGIVAPESDKDDMPIELCNITYTNDNTKVGLHLYNKTLNNLFEHFNLPFKESYISWQELSDWNIDSILQNLHDDIDALFLFDFGLLYHEDKNIGIGHAGIFVAIDENYMVEYLSPGPRFIGLGRFSSEDFVYAIRAKRGGISLISKP